MKLDYLADYPEYLELLTQWRHTEFGYLHPERTIENTYQKLQQHLNKTKFPIAYILQQQEQQKLLAMSCLREHDLATHHHLTPWLGSVIVSPAHRCQGIGKWLVEATMTRAKLMNFEKLYLWTPNKENFYAKMGWQTIEKFNYQNITPAVIMQIIL